MALKVYRTESALIDFTVSHRIQINQWAAKIEGNSVTVQAQKPGFLRNQVWLLEWLYYLGSKETSFIPKSPRKVNVKTELGSEEGKEGMCIDC